MTKFYRIAGLIIRLDAPFSFQVNDATESFRVPASTPDWTVTCSIHEQLDAQETLPIRFGNFRAGTVQGVITRTYLGVENHPYMQAVEAVDAPERMELRFSQQDLSWSARTMRLWLGVGLQHQLLLRGMVLLHASCIDAGGCAILFAAPSGTGKSTQAALWEQTRGAEIINGDKIAVGFADGRPCAFGVPVSGTSGICKNAVLPLRAIVLLSQAGENEAHRLRGGAALAQVCGNAVFDDWRLGEAALLMERVSRVLADVPVLALACTPDERAVETLEQALWRLEGEIR
ncbi:MAG: hypothetical protein HPZ79_02090 [Oscillospiraceae bacterium]|nr:hypothetical protein [Oscillospiraceae bacterium]